MGDALSCCLDRDQSGRIRYITKDEFQNQGVGYYALDCSVYNYDSFGVPFKAGKEYNRYLIKNVFNLELNDHFLNKNSKLDKTNSLDIFTKHLQDLQIGKEIPVMCYDLSGGNHAARVACTLSSIGIKNVTILDDQNWNPKIETKETDSKLPVGYLFDFSLQLNYFAKEVDFNNILTENLPTTYIVYVRSDEDKELKDTNNNIKYIKLSDFFKEGKLVQKEQILEVFSKAYIPKDTPLIFFGGDSAYVLKAIADHAQFKKTQVFEKSYEEWIAQKQEYESNKLKPDVATEQQQTKK